jgi:CHASE3 domain sensor protein
MSSPVDKASLDFGRRSEQPEMTQQVFEGPSALHSFLKDTETGQRGVLLTGQERYLELPVRVDI